MKTHTQQMDNQRHFNRGSWLTLGFVFGFTILCIAISVFLLTLPGDGCKLDVAADPPQPFLGCFGDWPTPLRTGDKLLSVNGHSTSDVDPFGLIRTPPAPEWAAQSTATYVVLRDGSPTTLVVPLGRLSGTGVLRAFGTALLMVDWVTPVFLGSLVVFLLAPRASAARLLLISSSTLFVVTTFVWSATTVVALFGSAPAWVTTTFLLLVLIWGWLFIPSALLIVLSFPRRIWPLTRWPRATPVLVYGLPLAGTAFALVTHQLEPYSALLALYALAVLIGAVTITLGTFLRGRDPVVRAQTAWMALGLVVGFGIWPMSGLVSGMLANLMPNFHEAVTRLPAWSIALLEFSVGLIFPISMGIAITRYRLFDIDIIIRRTLVYSLLTLSLGLVYVGCVVLLQQVIVPLTGGSELAIVASTLAIAALFAPLRRRIQTLIDKRFFRRKYNAANVLAAFGATARDETDLAQLTAEMLRVVDETIQPEFTGLWLREPGADR